MPHKQIAKANNSKIGNRTKIVRKGTAKHKTTTKRLYH